MSMIWTPDRQIIAPSRRVWAPLSRQRGFVCLPGGGLGAGRPGGGAPSYSTWNPADKGASVTLSNGNLTATVVAAISSVRGSQARNASDNRYFEVQVGSSIYNLVGIANSSASLSQYPGQNANSYGYFDYDGKKYFNGTGATYGATYNNTHFIGVHLNAGVLTFYKNGVTQLAAYSGLTGDWYPMWGPGSSGAGTRSATINVGASAFYALPSGASAWG